MVLISGLLTIAFFSACKQEAPPKPVLVADTAIHATYDMQSLPVSSLFSLTGSHRLQADSLKEISGLAPATGENGSLLWGEEDSGNKNAVYLLDTLGRFLGIKYLPGVLNLDWEDMSGGPGPEKGKYYLYLGDIGDNFKIRPFITVYRFEEPDTHTGKDTLVHTFDVINLAYPDGRHNAEALMVDPETKDIYVITKDSVAGVYVARYPQDTRQITKLTLLGTLPVSTVTAADISADGSQVLIKNYDNVFYWKRNGGESIIACLARTPLRLNYKRELQGEAIVWTRDGKGFYTLSEQVGNTTPSLNHYEFF